MTNPIGGIIGAFAAIIVILIILYLFFAAGFNVMSWPDYILCEWIGAEHRC